MKRLRQLIDRKRTSRSRLGVKKSAHDRLFSVEEYEPKILYSADVPWLQALDSDLNHSSYVRTVPPVQLESRSVEQSGNETNQDSRVLLIVDSRVLDSEQIIAQYREQSREIVVVELGQDQDFFSAIESLTAIGSSRPFDTMAIISHGESGKLLLGNQVVDREALTDQGNRVAEWQSIFTQDADLLIYGCDVGADPVGREFVSTLARLTGLDVAASSNSTGSSHGADWWLEVQAGDIEGPMIKLADYSHQLAIFTVTSNADSGAGSLRQAILDANADGTLDEIRFNLAQGQTTINLQSALPAIQSPLFINGTTQAGYEIGTPVVELRSNSGSVAVGLQFTGVNSSTGTVGVQGIAVSGFSSTGIRVLSSSYIRISDNLVGLRSSDFSLNGNGVGISIESSNRNVLTGNTISGNNQHGVLISGTTSSYNEVSNNRIGIDRNELPAGNGGNGVYFTQGAGINQVIQNTIAHNGANGILHDMGGGLTSTRNNFSENSIYSNALLAIDLSANSGSGDGKGINDAGDLDAGTNRGQNYPELSITTVDGVAQVSYRLDTDSTNVRVIEFFAADANSVDDARWFLGRVEGPVVGGYLTGTLALPTLGVGQKLVALTYFLSNGVPTWDRGGSTSELSRPVVWRSPPVVANVGTSVSFTENNSTGTLLFPTLTISVPGTTRLNQVAVQIGSNFQATADQLSFTNANGITGSYDAATGRLTLTASNSVGSFVSDFEAALRTVLFLNSSDAPEISPREVSVIVEHDGMVGAQSVQVNVLAVNDLPIGTLSGSTTSANEQTATSSLFDTSILSDVDSTHLSGLRVSINSAQSQTNDQLTFNNQSGIVGSWDDVTKVLTLSGNATVGQYQSALRSISFIHTGDTPLPSKQFNLAINDGNGWTNGAGRSVTIVASNDAPILTLTPVSVPASGSLILSSANFTITDNDSAVPNSTVINVITAGAGTRIESTSNPGVAITSFTLQNLIDGIVRIVRTNATAYSDAIVFRTTIEGVNSAQVSQQISYPFNALTSVVLNHDAPAPYIENAGSNAIFPNAQITAPAGTLFTAIELRYARGYFATPLIDIGNPASSTYTGNVVTLNGSYTEAQVESILRDFYFRSPTDSPGARVDFVLTLTTSTGSTNRFYSGFDRIAVPDLPTLVLNSNSSSYVEDGSPLAAFDTSVIGDDPDSTLLSRVVIRVSEATRNSADILSVGTLPTGISADFDSANQILTLFGYASEADYQIALRSVTFSSLSDNPGSTRVLEVAVSDGDSTSSFVSRTITIAAANDPPIAEGSLLLNLSEGQQAVLASSLFGISDSEGASASNLSIIVTNAPTGGRLELTSQPGVQITSFTLDDLLQNRVIYVHLGGEEIADQFAFRVNDGVTLVASQNSYTFQVVVTPVNDPTIIAVTSGSTTYREGDPAVALLPGISLADADPGVELITSAVVQIGSGFVAGEDELLGTRVGSIEVSYNATTGRLTLSGPGTIAQYQLALSLIQYLNQSEAPLESRPVSVALFSGANQVGSHQQTVVVLGTNDSPVSIASTGLSVLQGSVTPLSAGFVGVADPDTLPAGLIFTIQSPPSFGYLALAGNPLVSISSFTQQQIFSGQIVYVHNGGLQATDSLSLQVSDGEFSVTGLLRSINISPVSRPEVSAIDLTHEFVETASPTPVTVFPDIVVSDPGGSQITGATIRFVQGYFTSQDILTFGGQAGISGAFNSADGILVLSGTATLAEYQQVIRSITYANTSDAPSTDIRRIEIVVRSATATSTALTSQITVTPVNDAPALIIGSDGWLVNEGGTLAVTQALLSASDQDTSSEQLIFSITALSGEGYFYRTGSPLVSISTFSKAEIVSGTIFFRHDGSELPLTSMFSVSISDGSSPVGTTNQVTIVVSPVNDPFSVSLSGLSLTYTEQSAAITPLSSLVISDPDTVILTGARVTVTGGPSTDQDLLAFSTMTGITGTWDATTRQLTLSGTSSLANYQAALRSIRYSNPSDNPTESKVLEVSLSEVGGVFTPVTTQAIQILLVNDAPVLTGSGVLNLSEGGTQVISNAILNALDPDSLASSLTFSITNSSGRGRLELSTSPGVAISSFTISDLSNNRLVYVHLGGEETSDTFFVTVSDSQLSSGLFSISVNISPFDDPTTVVLTTTQVPEYIENGTGVVLLPGLTISDPDSNTLSAAIVSGIANWNAGEDLLTWSNVFPNLSVTFNAESGILQVTGNGTKAEYQSLLSSIRFEAQGENPNIETREFSLELMRSGLTVANLFQSVTVVAVNDSATLVFPAQTIELLEDTPFSFVGGAQISIADIDSSSQSLRLLVTVQNGYLDIDWTSPAFWWDTDYDFDGDGLPESGDVIELRGSVVEINLALSTLRYIPTENFFGPAAVQFRVVDLPSSGVGQTFSVLGTVNFNISAVNDAPFVVTNTGVTIDESEIVVLTESMLEVADVEQETNSLLFQVDRPPTGGILERISNPGQAVDQFTMEEIYSGAIRYMHGGVQQNVDFFDFRIWDGINWSETQRFEIAISGVNDAPVITIADGDFVVNEDAELRFATAPAIQLSDIDAGSSIMELKIEIELGTVYFEVFNGTFIDYQVGGSMIVTMRGALRDLNEALSNMVYSGPTDFSGIDRISFSMNDLGNTGSGGALSANAQIVIRIDPVNDAPLIGQSTDGLVAEGGSLLLSQMNLYTEDVDGGSEPLFRVVRVPNAGSIQDLSGNIIDTFTLSQLNAGLVRYVHSGVEGGIDSFEITASDGQTTSAALVVRLTIAPINDAPVILNVQGSSPVSVFEQTVSEPVLRLLRLVDDDSVSMSQAEIRISSGYQIGLETLQIAASDLQGLTSTWNTTTGTLTLSGVANRTTYEAVLRRLTFLHSADDPSATNKTIEVRIFDTLGASFSAATSINVIPVNDSPSFTAPQSTWSLLEDDSFSLRANIGARFFVADPDVSTGALRVVLTATSGTMSFESFANVSSNVSGTNAISQVELIGTAQAINAVIAGLTFSADADFNGQAKIDVLISDSPQVGSSSQLIVSNSVSIDVLPVADPIELVSSVSAIFREDDPSLMLGGLLQLRSPDAPQIDMLFIRLSSSELGGSLSVTNGSRVVGVWNDVDRELILSGSASMAEYQTVLNSLVYINGRQDALSHVISLRYSIVNNGQTTSGEAMRISYVTQNDTTAISGNASSEYVEGQAGALPWLNATLSDVDSQQLSKLEIRMTGGYQPGADQFDFSELTGASVIWDEAEGLLSVEGLMDINSLQSWLRSVSFSNSSALPSTVDRQVTLSVTDDRGDKSLRTFLIRVQDVNDAPTVSLLQQLVVAEDSAIKLDSQGLLRLQILDPDASDEQMTLELQVNEGSFELLSSIANVTVTMGNQGLSMTLQGRLNDLQSQIAAAQIIPTLNSTQTLQVSIAIRDQLGAANNSVASISILPVNDAPAVLVDQGALNWTVEGTGISPFQAVSLIDPDSSEFVSAVVQIVGNFQSGDELRIASAASVPSSLTVSWNPTTASLSLRGSATPEQYRQLLAAVEFTSTSNSLAERTIALRVADSGGLGQEVNRSLRVQPKSEILNPDTTGPTTATGPTTTTNPIDPQPTTPTNGEPTPPGSGGTGGSSGSNSNQPNVIAPVTTVVEALPSPSGTSNNPLDQDSTDSASNVPTTTALSRYGSDGGSTISQKGLNSEDSVATDLRSLGLAQGGKSLLSTFAIGRADFESFDIRIKLVAENSEGNNEFRTYRLSGQVDRESNAEFARLLGSSGLGQAALGSGSLRRSELDSISAEPEVVIYVSKGEEFRVDVLSLPAQGSGVVVSAVVLWWLTRAGGILTALLATMPQWQNFDPLPIVGTTDGRDLDDELNEDEDDPVIAL